MGALSLRKHAPIGLSLRFSRWRILPAILVLALPMRAAAEEPPPGVATVGDSEETPAAVRSVVVRRVVVDRFEGSTAVAIPRAGVVDLLEAEESVDLLSVRLLDAERRSLDGSADGYVEVAKKLGVVVIVRGSVERTEAGYSTTITIIGRDGHRKGKFDYAADTLVNLRKVLREELWEDFAPLLEEPEPEETESVVEAPEPEPEPEQDEVPKRPKPVEAAPAPRKASSCPATELEAKSGILRRGFGYEREQSGALRAFTLRYAVYAGATASLYPLAFGGCGPAAGLAVRFGYERLFGATARLGERELTTSASAEHVELSFELRPGVVGVAPHAGYAARHFAVSGGFIPDVDLRSVRGGVDVRLAIGVFLAELGGAGRYLFDAGTLSSSAWFPEATAYGYDARTALGVRPLPWLDVLLQGRLEAYRFDFHSDGSGAAYPNGVAAGARDRYLSGELVLRFRLLRSEPEAGE